MRVNHLWIKYLRSSRHQLCFTSELCQVKHNPCMYSNRRTAAFPPCSWPYACLTGEGCVFEAEEAWFVWGSNWHCTPQGAESHVIAHYGSAGLGLMCTLAPPFCAPILLLTGTSSTTRCPTGGGHIVRAYGALSTNSFSLCTWVPLTQPLVTCVAESNTRTGYWHSIRIRLQLHNV